MNTEASSPVPCPACGGAGGGPVGRAGSAWDDEAYVCPRCKGTGVVALDDVMAQSQRPGIVKAVPGEAEAPATKRKASA
jgi:DnaJ-class molecular chaperone